MPSFSSLPEPVAHVCHEHAAVNRGRALRRASSCEPRTSALIELRARPCAEGPQGNEEDAGAARRARRDLREGDPVGGTGSLNAAP